MGLEVETPPETGGDGRGRSPGSRRTQFGQRKAVPAVPSDGGDRQGGKDALDTSSSERAGAVVFKAPPCSEALQDMRRAYRNGDAASDSVPVKRLREFFASNPAQFMARLQAMEAEHRERIAALRAEWEKARGLKEGPAELLPRGAAEERLVGVIEQLLSRYTAAG